MSDVNFNVTTSLAGSGGGAGGGGFLKHLTFSPATSSTTSGTFVDVSGMVNQTIVASVSGDYLILMNVQARNGGTSNDADFRYIIDSDAFNEQLIDLQHMQLNTSTKWDSQTCSAVVTLTAGAHTIRPQWRMSSGGSQVHVDTSTPWTMAILAVGAGRVGGYQNLISASPTADTSTTSASFVDIPGFSNIAFTTSVSGTHVFTVNTHVYSNGGCDGQFRVVLDNVTFLDLPRFQAVGTSEIQSLTHLASTTLAAGAHNYRLQWRRVSGANTLFAWVGAADAPWKTLVEAQGVDLASSWVAFTPTGAFTTNTTYTGFYRKVGDTLECRVQLAFAGAPNATTCQINLPAGFTIDTTKVLSTTALEGLFGDGFCLDTGVTQKESAQVNYWTTTAVALLTVVSGSNAVQQVSNTAPFTFGNTDKIWVNFSVPVL